MFPSPALPWFELARYNRNRLARVAVAAVVLVPLCYGALYVWANLDPTGRLDNVKAAVVNQDEMIEVEGRDGEPQPVAVGRQLAGNLVGDDSSDNYDWQLTDAEDAQRGLETGEYKAVLTIPENLSQAATSTDGDPQDAVQGNLDLRTNDAVNYVNGAIAERILEAAKSALNAQVTETYLENVYLGFSDIRIALDEAADGADQLGDGAAQLADGAAELDEGARALADANGQLADGAQQLDVGANQLAAGLDQLEQRTAPLPGQTRRLADGSAQVAEGVAAIDRLVQTVTGAVLGATDGADGSLDELRAQLQAALEACRATEPAVDCSALEAAVGRSGELEGHLARIREGARDAGAQTSQLSAGARQVADGNAQLAAAMPELVGAIGQASSGADQLADGTGQLASGARQAADGANQLADGTGRLASGADELTTGALELRDGLREGAGDVPDYSEDEREQLAETAATPVEDATKRVNAVTSYGEALAPYFMALALWVGAMAIYLLLRPLSARALASTAGSVRTALAGFAPGAALSVLQAGLLVLVLEALVGIEPELRLLTAGLAVLTGLVFVAINQMFVAWFGGAGRFLALVFVCLQLTAAGATYPIETSPGFFGFLHGLLPMTYAVHGMRSAIAGSTTGIGTDVFALCVFLLLGLALTVLAARRRQTLTITRLHPTLVV